MKRQGRKWLEPVLLAAALALTTVGLALYALHGSGGYVLPGIFLCLVFLLPFFVGFEKSRPPAGLLVCIAVMSALAALSRVLFAAIPNVKPTTAIVIVTGMAFGPSAGFMTGAIAALASNLYFSQGIWTPWQMLAWGICGLAGGMLAKTRAKENAWVLGLWGAIASVLFGVLMNVSHVLGFVRPLTLASVLAAFSASVYFDLVHALSSFVFLLLFGRLWLRKLQRVNRKLEE